MSYGDLTGAIPRDPARGRLQHLPTASLVLIGSFALAGCGGGQLETGGGFWLVLLVLVLVLVALGYIARQR